MFYYHFCKVVNINNYSLKTSNSEALYNMVNEGAAANLH